MLDVQKLIGHFLALTHDVLDFFDLAQLIHKHLIALLQTKGVTLQLFSVILKGIHHDLPHLSFKLKPLRCLRVHYKKFLRYMRLTYELDGILDILRFV